jgi:hypothetical protein
MSARGPFGDSKIAFDPELWVLRDSQFAEARELFGQRPKLEDRRPKEGRNPNCRILSHRRGATAHRIKPFWV